ncbi:hypothetical protein [Carboxylicivirga sp. RSCT41]|uniref:hypothetical protein n=1 Tax=Carboxylicivirga agarovorans TaxID=3417570 RepID=UPI003D3491E2
MKKTTLPLVILFVRISSFLHAQSFDYAGPVSSALAFTKVFDSSSWACLSNVSNLAERKHLTVGVAYQMRFNIKELSSRAATLVAPSSYGTFSGLVFQSGYAKSNYSRYGLAYSRLFGDELKAGFQFNYVSHQIEAADRADAFYSSLGLNVDVSERFELGVFIQNPEQGSIRYHDDEYTLPSYFNTGIKYSVASHFMSVVEVEKQLEYDLVYKAALQLSFKNKLFVRGGVKGRPAELTVGGGFSGKGLMVDIGFAHHQQLGVTSGAGLSYSFKQKQK